MRPCRRRGYGFLRSKNPWLRRVKMETRRNELLEMMLLVDRRGRKTTGWTSDGSVSGAVRVLWLDGLGKGRCKGCYGSMTVVGYEG